jgi:hypothetical protein
MELGKSLEKISIFFNVDYGVQLKMINNILF